MNLYNSKVIKNTATPTSLMATVTVTGCFYILMEWIFIITKPSFMSILPWFEKLLVFFLSASLFTSVCLFLQTPIALINSFSNLSNIKRVFNYIGLIIPTVIIASITLLLIDNFTYTIFKFGIINSSGVFRGVYGAFYIFLVIAIYPKMRGLEIWFESKISKMKSNEIKMINFIFFPLICTMGISPFIVNLITRYHQNNDQIFTQSIKLPDILLITADSLDASHMSVYGYERDTTPFLNELSSLSLFAINAFSNAQGTTGSIVSMLTGKDPLDTRVIYSPDILRGNDSYEHLPGLLTTLGYYNVQLSFDYYVDAFDLNFLNGFDEVNGRIVEKNDRLSTIRELLPTNEAYFIYEIGNRVYDRIRHIFFIERMENPYLQVTGDVQNFDDQYKIDRVKSLINNSTQPLFIHLHWMGTHGPSYTLNQQVFSKGQEIESQGKYNIDFYDDSILEFDQAISSLWDELKANSLQDNSIIIIASDHSQKWSVSRLPLIIHFPNAEYTQTILENVSYIDIAPTILDYMNVSQPPWMVGHSLIDTSFQSQPIFISTVGQTTIDEVNHYIIHTENTAPPFFQFGKISVVECGRWYQVDLLNLSLTFGDVEGYTTNCDIEKTEGEDEALYLIINQLQTYRFDTASLEQLLLKNK
jgi:arylsulfatase A-like enzyme